ncbi:MAG: VOC family protein [Azospirillaceae bacterium]
MGAAIRGIDHALVATADLDRADAAWRRLGFATTPRGRHEGWGTGNVCVMMPHDYVELLGIRDPTQDLAGLDAALAERGEGLMGLALDTGDADAAHEAFAAAGIAGDGPAGLWRWLDLPEGPVKPSFRLVHPSPRDALGLPGFVCQHETPELMRRPAWLEHANGARRIAFLTVAVADPAALAPVWRVLVGDAAVHLEGGGLTVRLGGAALHAGAAGDGPARPLGLGIAVADLDRAAAWLAGQGVAFERAAGRLDVDPAEATGVALSLLAERE